MGQSCITLANDGSDDSAISESVVKETGKWCAQTKQRGDPLKVQTAFHSGT